MAEIDDLKSAVSDLVTKQAAFNVSQSQFDAELKVALTDIQTKLQSMSSTGIDPTVVEAQAQAIVEINKALDANTADVNANTATLTAFDATLKPAAPAPTTPTP